MTPAAPTAISPAVLGTKTVRYACVGYDAYGGLTAASPIGSLARAAAILGANSQAIASISRGADGTLTIVTQKPHNFLLRHLIRFYDLIVGATALERGSQVATYNKRHFSQIRGLSVIEPK